MPCPMDLAYGQWLPAGAPGRRLDHGRGARVGEAGQPVLDRVPAGRGGELVHERLGREHVEERAEGAERGRAQRHVQQPVVDYLVRGKVVTRHGIAAGPAAAGHRQFRGGFDVPAHDRPQAARPKVRAWPGRVPVSIICRETRPGLVQSRRGSPARGRTAPSRVRRSGSSDTWTGHGTGYGEQGGVRATSPMPLCPWRLRRYVVTVMSPAYRGYGRVRRAAVVARVRPHPEPGWCLAATSAVALD